MGKIKVLIADDNDATRDGTRRLLEYEDDIEIVDFAENGLVAIEKVKELRPHVVLMDINMPVMDGLTATQRLQAEAPRTQIVIVSVQDDANYMREAIRAGAVDFVAKPISSDELAEAIRRAYSKIPPEVPTPAQGVGAARAPAAPGYDFRPPSSEGHIITVLGPKGGVGKTTVAVNVGVGLSRADSGKKVLIIDGNVYFGDVSVFLNTRAQYSIADMAAMAEVPEEIDPQSSETILAAHESGVKLLIAPTSPSDGSHVSMTALSNMLSYFKKHYDYVVVDTATTFDDILASAIQASDRLILVTEPTMPALKDARIMFSELAGADYDMNRVFLVLNRVEKTNRITAEQIAHFLRHSVNVQIPSDPTVNEALNRGVPLVTLDFRRVPAVRPLLDLIQLVRTSFEPMAAEEPLMGVEQPRSRGGLFSAFRG